MDLGAAPGGWTQAARKLVGDSGFVLAVDVKRMAPVEVPNVLAIIGDVAEPHTIQNILKFLPRSADAVISDVSPNVSGIWELDHARQIDLANNSLRIATSILRFGGNFFVKIFQGRTTSKFIEEVRQNFSFVKLVKPKASRSKSAELYILGRNFIKT